MVTAYATGHDGGTGLVLEGSALWPVRVAELTAHHVVAVWLTLDEAVVRARVRDAGRYAEATDGERHLMDKFLARTVRYQTLMADAVDRLGLARVDAGGGRSVEQVVNAVLTAVGGTDGDECDDSSIPLPGR